MGDKLIKAGVVIIGVGVGCMTRAYGKYMYAKGLLDADEIYRPILDTDHKLIHTLVEKLRKADGSQK